MSGTYLYIAAALVIDGIAGLSGGLVPSRVIQRHFAALLAFAAGTLTAAAFLDMLPAAFSSGHSTQAMLGWALGGFVIFFGLETFLGGHQHEAVGPMVLLGDALHNTTDGVAIAAAFSIDLRVGIATSLAVLVHEIPQEIGDYAILISRGYTRGRALFYLFLVQFTAVLGAIGTLIAADLTGRATGVLVAISGGGFIYIAAANVLPQLHRRHEGRRVTKVLSFCAGIGVIALLAAFVK